jgi:hypothetical protein
MKSVSFLVGIIILLLLSMVAANVDFPTSPSKYDHDLFLNNFDGNLFHYTYLGDDGLINYGEVSAQFNFDGASYSITSSILNYSLSVYDYAGQTNIFDDPYTGDVFVIITESPSGSYSANSHILRFQDYQLTKEFVLGDKLYFGVQDGGSYNIYYYDTSADTIHNVFDLKRSIFGDGTSYYSFSLHNQLVNDTLYLLGTYMYSSAWTEEHSLFAITLDGLSTNSTLMDTLSGGWIQDLSEYNDEVFLVRKTSGVTNITIYSGESINTISTTLEYSQLYMTNNTDLVGFNYDYQNNSVYELSLFDGVLEENWCVSIPSNMELSNQKLVRDGRIAFAIISDSVAKFYLKSPTSIPQFIDNVLTATSTTSSTTSVTTDTSSITTTEDIEVVTITETETITPTFPVFYNSFMGALSLMVITFVSRRFFVKDKTG